MTWRRWRWLVVLPVAVVLVLLASAGRLQLFWSVSYTHLTLPTIYSV